MSSAPADHRGEDYFVSQLAVIERVIAFVCAKHYLQPADAEDFASHVKLKIIEDDYAVLRKFKQRAQLRTYLTVVIANLFRDYRISAWGKWRPSQAARSMGRDGVLLEQLLVRDGHAFEEAYELLRTNYGVTLSRAELERMAGRLPVRPRRRFEADDALAEAASADPAADEIAADRDRQELADRVCCAITRLIAAFDPQDRLIMRMLFNDGRTVAKIAATLELEQKPLYPRLQRLLVTLRQGLEAEGIDGTSVLEMLESRTVSTAWNEAYGKDDDTSV